MKLVEHQIAITTTAGGASTDTTEDSVFGKLYAVVVSNGTLAATADLTITYTNPDSLAITLLTLTDVSGDATYYPRHQVHDNAGAGLTLDGTRIAYDLPLVAGKIKIVTAQGGATKAGKVYFYVFED